MKMTVAKLIELLKEKPQDAIIGYQCYSENIIMTANQIKLVEACAPRDDGWIHDARPDKPTVTYVMFPGN